MNRDDDDFLSAFLQCSLPPAEFGHVGHLRLSWILLRRLSFDDAVERICDGILRYATHLGAAGKFHRTITVALLHVLRSRGAADPALDWLRFLASNRDLVDDAKAILLRHYSEDMLASGEARSRFVAPDREPLPGEPAIAG
ncbi:MAG TPA: hypothetical protein VEC06_07745 [Paucimonas sp.]|nr:hypothetical protein [Paucimonas sp.]